MFLDYGMQCKVNERRASDLRANPLCVPELLEAGLQWAVACPWCKPPLRESVAGARHAASCSDQVLQSGLIFKKYQS